MATFYFKAFDKEGKKQKGAIDAIDLEEAKQRVKEKGFLLSEISIKGVRRSQEHLKGENLLTFTVQLAQLVNAKVPIYESLVAIEEQVQGEPYYRVISSICDQIKRGVSLSEAMKPFPKSFDKIFIAMIAAGEASGSLGPILNGLVVLLNRQIKLKNDLSSALIYPSILATFSLFIIAMLLGFVVPSIEGIFDGKKLNLFTQMVLGISSFFRNWSFVIFPLLLVGAIGAYFKLKTEKGKIWQDQMRLTLPLLSQVTINAAVARFCRTMSTLQKGGLPLHESLKLSLQVIKNIHIEKELESTQKKIVEGSSFSFQLKHSLYFPKLVARMVAIGEDTGSLPVMLEKIAEMYENELEKKLSQLVAFAQPVILIVMGGVIGLIMVAILLPLTNFAALST